ncbi:50S ribosomal protein L18 [candidate division KSB1 bacterium]
MRDKQKTKQKLFQRKVKHIRKNISGTSDRPRLVVSRGTRNISAQLIDDSINKTLATVTSVAGSYISIKDKSSDKMDISKQVGLDIAKKAGDLKITKVVFDRRGYKYHGRVKMVAEGAREGGLKF